LVAMLYDGLSIAASLIKHLVEYRKVRTVRF
jgi:DNA mismatch repair ATPase MutS